KRPILLAFRGEDGPVRSAVPEGTRELLMSSPSVETLGYPHVVPPCGTKEIPVLSRRRTHPKTGDEWGLGPFALPSSSRQCEKISPRSCLEEEEFHGDGRNRCGRRGPKLVGEQGPWHPGHWLGKSWPGGHAFGVAGEPPRAVARAYAR